jgi:hypothetical protein
MDFKKWFSTFARGNDATEIAAPPPVAPVQPRFDRGNDPIRQNMPPTKQLLDELTKGISELDPYTEVHYLSPLAGKLGGQPGISPLQIAAAMIQSKPNTSAPPEGLSS